MTDEDDVAAIRDRVLLYLADRRAFEEQAPRTFKSHRKDPERDRILQDAYDSSRSKHISSTIEGIVHWNMPPAVDPSTTVFVDIKVNGDRAVVLTDESLPWLDAPARFKYRLDREHDGWRLSDRRGYYPSDRIWIQDVL
ncbi:MAG: hypothetical protein KF809_12960 [Chloroflexi bacterium]|nr:hypothetical protein [Chloroflexota bacterium]